MFTHLKITLRNLRREKFYAAINVLGLAVAIVCTFLIGVHVRSELTYDQHVEGHENIYRANIDMINASGTTTFAQMSQFMGPALAAQNPAIEAFVRFRGAPLGERLVRVQGEPYYWSNVYEADDNVFDVFGHTAIYGDMQTALVDPGAAAISNRFNQIHFGGADSIGQTISVNNRDYRVALVYEDQPVNTHFKYDILLSINGLAYPEPEALPMSLFMVNTYTYFVMTENASAANFSAFFDEYWANTTGELLRGSGLNGAMHITPIADVHYGPAVENDQPVGNIFVVYAYMVIGALILLVACINYINLSTARSAGRLKEVAVRKVLGVNRGALIVQFLLESVCIALASGVLALAALELLVQSGVVALFSSALQPALYRDPTVLAIFLLGSVTLGLLSGLYPAFYLSSRFVMPGKVRQHNNRSESVLRRALVVFQFAVTVSVIACSLLIVAQMRYIQNAPLGFDRENRVVVDVQGVDFIERIPVLTDRLQSLPYVTGVTLTALDPGVDSYSGNWQLENNDGALEPHFLNFQNVDSRYLDVMNMELVAGRFFDQADARNLVVVNETLVKQMGWTDPIGKRSGLPTDVPGSEIVGGVVRDFHFAGLQTAIGPLILRQTNPDFYSAVTDPQQRAAQTAKLTIALADNAGSDALGVLESLWRELIPELPFDYLYLDDIVRQQYDSENRIVDIIAWFAAVCILISCLGLLGLSAYSTERRTREIGIRKVFGASAGQIMGVLFRNIFVLVCIGSVIASFVSYYSINAWLQNFAYRDEINLLVFPAAALLAIVSAFLTMALQSWSTIRRNPVYALRYE
ncbi:MAG: ABC transporter permease [Gammaproteobacteria bacterium]|nr:ABC transporter permease [Gammaproteobacteria bacterium]MDP2347534.1 ABC transporter permease [Gammaproteobacteria bacterium]